MPAPFRRIDIDQFAELVRLFDFKRKITAFHVHHTFIPARSDFKGLKSIEAMDRFHRTVRGFSDIAQHITLDPDGFIWTGRSWNAAPASATGFNGNSKAGPFMMEMVGNFDKNKEPFDGQQAANAYRIVALILRRFELGTDAIRFHNEMSDKTCPGSSIVKAEFVAKVQEALNALPRQTAYEEDESLLREALSALLEPLDRDAVPRTADIDGEPSEEAEAYEEYVARTALELDVEDEARAAECPTLTQLTELVPHVVNLRGGRFAADDLFVSNAGTVDAIFAGLDAQLQDQTVPKPLKIVFFAHGGLVSQRAALCKAHRDLWWWKKNGIYPIFFVWHTDLGSAFGDILLRSREGRRDLADISDRLIEGFVRRFGGVAAWDSMKLSASVASSQGGGAFHVAKELKKLVTAHGANVECHAIGHSAGAIFHSHFLNAANVPFASLQMLAPAIRIDEYRSRIEPLFANNNVRVARIYTMRDKAERDDNCATVYRKSLLYLISRGLEPDRDEPILGMERFLTKDDVVKQRFGIGSASSTGEVIFSPSERSAATAHGCFDDDVRTMNSIAKVIRGSDPSTSYSDAGAGKCAKATVFAEARALPPELEVFFPRGGAPIDTPPAPIVPSFVRATGRRRALCVGINTYPRSPLRGCVADAELWARTFTALGFEAPLLLVDSGATRQGILDALGRLLETSVPGDVVAFQFAGHGADLEDRNGDERGGRDQALCPVDFEDGAFLVDDDVARLFTRIPAGVSVTCFLDHCFSGTATRFAVGRSDTRAAAGDIPRFIPVDEQLQRRHDNFRRSLGAAPRLAVPRGPDTMREVVFSASRSGELAWESNGQGDFTRNAVALLNRRLTLTNDQFQDRLTDNFTPSGRQHPTLDCARTARHVPLFGFGIDTPPPAAKVTKVAPATNVDPQDIACFLRDLASTIEYRG